jgi:hypothetical protein
MADIQNLLNPQNIAIVVGIVAVIGVTVATKGKSDIKKMIYQGMLVAKDKAKDGLLKTGKEQKQFVIDLIMSKCPAKVKLFVGENNLETMVQTMYNGALDLIDDGQLNDSVK